jgi:hypothetical protein
MSGNVWTYRPSHHKTEHLNQEREVFLGPRAREIIKPWLKLDTQAYLFDPRESEAIRSQERRRNRQTPMTPSQANRKRQANRGRAPRDHYDVIGYRRAIHRACVMADKKAHQDNPTIPANQVIIPKWSPNRLRHNAATWLRKQFGIEIARIVLGHNSAFATLVYAEEDRQKASAIVAKVG